MSLTFLSRDETLKLIGLWDKKSNSFLKKSIDWWDRQYDWKEFAPLVCKEGSDVCGIFFYNITKGSKNVPKRFAIQNILVPEMHRNKGIARRLLLQGWQDAVLRGSEQFRLNCDASALNFYKKLGFGNWGLCHNEKDFFSMYPIVDGDFHKTMDYWQNIENIGHADYAWDNIKVEVNKKIMYPSEHYLALFGLPITHNEDYKMQLVLF